MIRYFLIASLATACVGDDTAQLSTNESSLVTLDSSALTPIPGGTIPTARLTRSAFTSQTIARGLIQTGEAMARVDALGSRTTDDSANWSLETDGQRGTLLVLRKHEGGAPVTSDPVMLQRDAVARLNSWGLPSTELGRVLQRRAAVLDDDDPERPRLFAHKTFAFRQVLGIPVEEHRAVVTHALDGTFQRALIRWPPLAASGHLLHTRLTRDQIERLALATLARENITNAAVTLRWRYLAELMPTGEVKLRLSVAAHVPSPATEEIGGEPRDIDVDVSPVE